MHACDRLPCHVSAWSGWGGCEKPAPDSSTTPDGAAVMVAVKCGGDGRQSRARIVLRRPAAAGRACPAIEETRACVGNAALPCAQRCQLGPWSSWGPCAPTANAVAARVRAVLVYPVRAPVCGALREERACAKVDCVLSHWGAWGPCSDGSSSSGSGRRQQRQRAVSVPPRGPGARACGDLTQYKDCETPAGRCAASAPAFGPLTPCATTGPDAGTRSRVRVLPAALSAMGCASYERHLCAVSCAVGPWGRWGVCDVQHDQQRRARSILVWPQVC